jgi:hypothetical protein
VNPEKSKKLRPSESHRLLIGSGRYTEVEKQFASVPEMRDWLSVNTLLPNDSIDRLFAEREIEFNTSSKPEWFKYLPPVKKSE